MYIRKVLLFVLFSQVTILYAQNTFQIYDQRAKSISAIEDLNEKRFQLVNFATDFKNFLLANSSSVRVNEKSYIQSTKSSDSKYTVYYYNTFHQGKVLRVDWFVLYGDISHKRVYHSFEDQIKFNPKKGNGELLLHLARIPESKVDLYPLSFSFKSDLKIYKEYKDIASICFFEELLIRETTTEREALNDSILKQMEVLWNKAELFNDRFVGIKRMSTVISDDENVKLCTWNVLLPDSRNKFYGAVITKNKEEIKVQLLEDYSHKIRSPEKSALTPRKWYGAVYYQIADIKDSKYGTYYLLVGYKPNSEMTKKKVVEAMLVVGNGQVRFGHSVFLTDRNLDKRLVFEYNAATTMMLQYDAEEKRIVLDHLAPTNPMFKDNRRFYGPDFTYDGYSLEKGKWTLIRDIDLRNPEVHHVNGNN